jgi:hypothetical protein
MKWIVFLLFALLLAGCQLAGPMIVDPYYQAGYEPKPDDRVEFRQAFLSDDGRLRLVGWIWTRPQPMVYVNRGFEVTFTLPDQAQHLSTLIVDHHPDLIVKGGKHDYEKTVASVPQGCNTPDGQRVGMAMLRNGQYRRWLIKSEVEGGFIPLPEKNQKTIVYLEPGGFDGFLSTGVPAPASAQSCESRLVIYKLDNRHHKFKRNSEYLLVGRPTLKSDHLVIFLQSTGELVNRLTE